MQPFKKKNIKEILQMESSVYSTFFKQRIVTLTYLNIFLWRLLYTAKPFK